METERASERPASILPCPSALQAGSLWRNEALDTFEKEAMRVGMDSDPHFLALWKDLKERTSELDRMAQLQEREASRVPWWADGVYDALKASRLSEKAQEDFSKRKDQEALVGFTEAARLAPECASHHSNRSAAALRLKRYDIAAEAAEESLRRCPNGLKARIRAGEARKMLGDLDEAMLHFEEALKLDGKNARALRGWEESRSMKRKEEERKRQEKLDSEKGARKGLPLCTETEDEAAELLYTAELMCRAQPRLEAAKTSRVEALILCRRYEDASQAIDGLVEGLDRTRLEAEVLWRSGEDVDLAWKKLMDAPGVHDSEACSMLLEDLEVMVKCKNEVDLALEEERFQDAIEASTQALRLDGERRVAPNAYNANVLHGRSIAYRARGMREQALEDLNLCLNMCPEFVDALKSRASLFENWGRFEESLGDYFRLQDLDATIPGLLDSMARVAALCQNKGRYGQSTPAALLAKDGQGEAHCLALEISPNATALEVRRAYRKLASQWHPDKWMTQGQEARQDAERRFLAIQAAYEALAPQEMS